MSSDLFLTAFKYLFFICGKIAYFHSNSKLELNSIVDRDKPVNSVWTGYDS